MTSTTTTQIERHRREVAAVRASLLRGVEYSGKRPVRAPLRPA